MQGYKGENISCGSWKTEIEAVRARDKVIIRMGLPTHKLQIFKKVENE